MVLLRSLLFFVLMLIIVTVFGVLLVLLGWLPMSWKETIANTWADVTLWLLKWICGLDYRVRGMEHLPQGAVVVMAKHQSAWETIALRSILRGNQSWVLKRELMWLPVFGWALAVLSPIAIDRSAGRRAVAKVVEQGVRYLAKGHRVIIFPEGTRTAPGVRGRYGKGGAILAEHSGIPVLPIAHNAGVFWKRRGIKKYPGTIDVVIGPPIQTEGRKSAAIISDVETWIEGQMETLPDAS